MTQSSDDLDEQIKAFPLQAKVILQGLSKAPEYNGKTGVVMSSIKDGRQQVLVGKKFLGLKPSNMTYQLRSVDSLSMQELKKILKEKDENVNFSGMDVSDLRRDVYSMEPEVAFECLSVANAKEFIEKEHAKEQQAQESRKTMKSQADQISQMSPDQLRLQARMMRTMAPDQIRKAHPQLRHMTDAQIQMAATQMEQMADNPELVRMAAEQVKNMSPEEYQRAQQQQVHEQQPATAAAAGYGTRTAAPANQLDSMTPEQLKEQAEAMRRMTPEQIRQLNPQLASLTDEQMEQTVQQMEQMANNPAMFEMAKRQMKGMSSDDIANLKAGGPMPAGMDPSKMLESMDGKQLKEMVKMMKENPEMLKQMGSQGEQMMKALKMFDGMDETQLDSAVSMMKGVQKATAPVRNAYAKVNGLCGGHLFKVMVLLVIIYVGMFIYLRFFAVTGGGVSAPGATMEALKEQVGTVPAMDAKTVNDDEF